MRIEFERITRDSGSADEAARRSELAALLGPDLASGALIAWIAEAEGRAAGQSALRLAQRRARGEAGPGAAALEAELMNVFVRPEFRRRGLGEALVAAALEEARAMGVGRITLQGTEDSRRIYERAGFRGRGGRMILDLRDRARLY
jgi:GNAT superfamily N-acetyltransferase